MQMRWSDEFDWKTLGCIVDGRLDETVLESARALHLEFDEKNLTFEFSAVFRIVES